MSKTVEMTESVIGVDLGGTKVLGAVVDGGELRAKDQRPVRGLELDALLDTIGDLVDDLREKHPDVRAVGMGLPSLIDRETAIAVSTVHLPIQDFPIRDHFEERFGLPVAVENDANCAAIAESLFGAGAGTRVTVCLTVGTGVGSGVVVDGQILRGGRGYATEIGHMVIDRDGPPCPGDCPNRGCLESLASGKALERMTGGRRGEEVLDLVRGGNSEMKRIFEELARNLGVGIASVINIFNPDVVVIGGGLSSAGDLLLRPAENEARRRALPTASKVAQIVIAELGQNAGVIGAGLVAQRALP